MLNDAIVVVTVTHNTHTHTQRHASRHTHTYTYSCTRAHTPKSEKAKPAIGFGLEFSLHFFCLLFFLLLLTSQINNHVLKAASTKKVCQKVSERANELASNMFDAKQVADNGNSRDRYNNSNSNTQLLRTRICIAIRRKHRLELESYHIRVLNSLIPLRQRFVINN